LETNAGSCSQIQTPWAGHCQKVVELHQGQVHVGCDENSTTFTVVLPCFIDG
jgi:hypothetical protein